MKNKSIFCSQCRQNKMSVKRKLNTKTLTGKCDILSHIEKGITNKQTADKFGLPKNTISTWIKKKENIFQVLDESPPNTKKLRGC